MTAGHKVKFVASFMGQLDVLNTPVVFSTGSGDEAVFLQPIDDAGDVAVGYHELTRKFGHGHLCAGSLKFGKHVKLRQGDREIISKQRPELLFNNGFAGHETEPGTNGFLASRFVLVKDFFVFIHRLMVVTLTRAGANHSVAGQQLRTSNNPQLIFYTVLFELYNKFGLQNNNNGSGNGVGRQRASARP